MNKSVDAPFLNDLALSFTEAWRLLGEGADNRHSPLHTLNVATVTPENTPSQRIMVLRSVDPEKHLLRFNTDARVSKVSDIALNNKISILGYHPEAKVQIRLSGSSRIETDSAATDAAWEQASLYGKRCYLANPAPGTRVESPISGLDPQMEGRKPEPAEILPARANFAILLADIDRIEWLYLAHTGHRRAEFIRDSETYIWTHHWLVP